MISMLIDGSDAWQADQCDRRALHKAHARLVEPMTSLREGPRVDAVEASAATGRNVPVILDWMREVVSRHEEQKHPGAT